MFADANLLENDEFLLAMGLLLAALVSGGLVLVWLDRWRKKQAKSESSRTTDALTTYRALYDRGELTKEEYAVIRGQLAMQMRDEIGLPPPPPKAKPEPGE